MSSSWARSVFAQSHPSFHEDTHTPWSLSYPPLSVCCYWTQVEGLELKCLQRRSLFHFDFEKNCKSIDSIALRKWKYWYRWDWLWLPDSPSRSTPATSPRRPSFTNPTDPFCPAALSLSDSCQTKPVVFAYYCSCSWMQHVIRAWVQKHVVQREKYILSWVWFCLKERSGKIEVSTWVCLFVCMDIMLHIVSKAIYMNMEAKLMVTSTDDRPTGWI